MDLPILESFKDKLGFSSGAKRYFNNTGWLFVGRVSALVVAFFVSAYMARYLGPDQYGALNYILSFAGLFAFLPSLGTDVVISRELVKHPELRDEMLGTGFIIKAISGMLTVAVIFFASFIAKNDGSTTACIVAYSFVFVFQAFNVIDLYYQAHVLSRKTVQVQLISMAISTVLKIVFIYLKLGVFWFVLVYLLDTVTLAIGWVVVYYRNNFRILEWCFNIHKAKAILKDSWPLMLSVVSMVIYLRIDQVMIRHMLNDTAVGVYAVAAKLSEVWYFIPGAICASLFPAIVNAKKIDHHLYQNRLQKLYSLMLWFAIAIALFTTFFAGYVVKILFGNAYLGAVGALRIYIWAGVGTFLSTAIGQYLIVENYTGIIFFSAVVGAVSNVAINLFFIPRYGIIGAAVATLISYTLVSLSIVAFRKTRGQLLIIFRALFFMPYKRT